MPYEIITKDGITIRNIPDNVPPDSPDLKRRVAAERAKLQGGTPAPVEAPEPSLLDRVKAIPGQVAEAFTGRERETATTQALPDWAGMPELNEFSVASAKTGLGTMLSDPAETVQVIQANFPGVRVRKDEKGNFVMRSSRDGKEYAYKPGFRISDIPRALGGIAAFTPAGRVASIGGAALAGGATQAGIEATQEATGGSFNPGEVALAGGLGAAGQVVSRAGGAVSRGVAERVAARRAIRAQPRAAPVAPVAAPPVAAPPVAVAASVAPLAPEAASAQVGKLINKASGSGIGSGAARVKLAEIASVNPEAKAAAERLGIELPADVFSDSPQVREAVGLTRAIAGSDASASWDTAVTQAIDRADDVMAQFDTAFVEGGPSIGAVSQKVRDSLTAERSGLSTQAQRLYSQVDEAVPKETAIDMPRLRSTLAEVTGEVGEGGMTAQESRLAKMIDDGAVTYGRLIREKNLIGKALANKESPYGSLDEATLKRLYGALAEDQLEAVGAIGGDALRQQLRTANLIYAKERGLGKRIVQAFGEDIDGSIANVMRNAITSGAKGDSAGFAKLLKVVPEDLRRETVATALASVTRSNRGKARGGFGFDEFAKTYRGLRSNPPVYSEIVKTLGPESDKVLRDLYEVSQRITTARANATIAGKSNRVLVDSMKAEGLAEKVLRSTTMRTMGTGAAAMAGGPMAAMGASTLASVLQSGKKDAIKAAGDLFRSDEFQKLAIEAATQPEVSLSAMRRLATSAPFARMARAAKLPNSLDARVQWIQSGLMTAENLGEGDNDRPVD